MTVLRPYGPTRTFSYTPATVGTYSIRVYARNQGSTAAYEAARWISCPVIADPPVTSVTLDANPPASQRVNLPVTFTATATGGGTNKEYEFAVKDPVSGVMTVLQPYGASGTFLYTPTTVGTCNLRVYVRNQGTPSAYEAARWMNYTATP